MPNVHHPQLFTQTQIMELLGVPETTLDAWRRLRIGPPTVRVGRDHYYPSEMVEPWLQRGAHLEHGISLLPPRLTDNLKQPLLVEGPPKSHLASGM